MKPEDRTEQCLNCGLEVPWGSCNDDGWCFECVDRGGLPKEQVRPYRLKRHSYTFEFWPAGGVVVSRRGLVLDAGYWGDGIGELDSAVAVGWVHAWLAEKNRPRS